MLMSVIADKTMENQNGFSTPNCTQSSRRGRPSPLPQLNSSDSGEMWESMILTGEIYSRDAHMLTRHQNITSLSAPHLVPKPTSTTGSNSRSNKSIHRPRRYKCKQCDYIAISKLDFWAHRTVHIKREKQLSCPNCPFVTEFKHHLEYHLRNHFNSKPFMCSYPGCKYTCVNKSMLNSHLKSHSNVYQFQCRDCSYATKYCHSLKMHLRKYKHSPSPVLNLDGTINPFPIIDVYGTRRGPKSKVINKDSPLDLTVK